jgi:hypothetical protein
MDEKPPSRRRPIELPIELPEPDPATRAFARLEGEMALLRRAVEHLATEKAEIEIPDYSNTLAQIAKSQIAIERKPAMQMTPEDMAARIAAAAAQARRDDQTTLAEAKQKHVDAAHALARLLGKAATINEQRRRLKWAAGGGLLAGMLLWSFLPGVIARALPASWHLPERIAARTVGEPTLWEAGTRIMRADSPEAWQTIADAAEMRRDNREAIDACERDSRRSKQPVRCTIRVRAGPR